MTTSKVEDVVSAWKLCLDTAGDWQTLVEGVTPKETGCGPVYELDNPIDRPGESFAVADMRALHVAEPHYHANGETEIYFVLTGSGRIVVGSDESEISKGSVIVTPPDTAHFTLPEDDLVLAVVNTPPFNADNYKPLTASNPDVGFDQDKFNLLAG